MTPPEVRIEPTFSFLRDVDAMAAELGEAAAIAVLEALGQALARLEAYDWAGGLPLEPHGRYGDTYRYLFHEQFAVILRRETARDAEKRPVLIHLYLKNLVRR